MIEAIATPATRRRTMPIWSPTTAAATSPGSSSPATRCWSATSAGRICTPRARRASRSWRGPSIGRSTSGCSALPDHLLVYPAHYAGSVCGRGLSGHPGLDASASSAGTTGRSRLRLRGRVRRGAVLKDIPPAPEHQAEIVAANRSGESSAATGLRARRSSLGCARTRPVLAPGRGQRPRRGDGRPGALDPAADRREHLRGQLLGRGPLLHRRLRARQVA